MRRRATHERGTFLTHSRFGQSNRFAYDLLFLVSILQLCQVLFARFVNLTQSPDLCTLRSEL